MKYTPGPWTNDNGLVNGMESRERFQPGVSIDIFDASDWPRELREEAMDNAKLIASSLEMLAALKNIAGGHINIDFAMQSPPDWHSAFSQLQKIAQDVLSKQELED